jgi:hypothetical protein
MAARTTIFAAAFVRSPFAAHRLRLSLAGSGMRARRSFGCRLSIGGRNEVGFAYHHHRLHHHGGRDCRALWGDKQPRYPQRIPRGIFGN